MGFEKEQEEENVSCPENAGQSTHKKRFLSEEKKELYILGAVFLGILLVYVFLFGIRINALHQQTQHYNMTTEKLGEANALYDEGRYEEALPIYASLTKNYWSIDRANSCRYLLGRQAMESEDWELAKRYFSEITVSGYEDSEALLEICSKELGDADRSA